MALSKIEVFRSTNQLGLCNIIPYFFTVNHHLEVIRNNVEPRPTYHIYRDLVIICFYYIQRFLLPLQEM